MTAPSPREHAAQEVARLTALLVADPHHEGVVPELIELGGHLERAIRAFHMEAIRFRAFTMRRLIKQHADTLSPEVPAAMEAVGAALEAAGFHTKSVST